MSVKVLIHGITELKQYIPAVFGFSWATTSIIIASIVPHINEILQLLSLLGTITVSGFTVRYLIVKTRKLK